MYIELAIFALFVFCYTLVAGRLERAPASGPIVFVASGFLMGPLVLGWFDGDFSRTELRVIADLTLALILFIDAANADLAVLKRQFRIPSRMLLLGLPGVGAVSRVTAARKGPDDLVIVRNIDVLAHDNDLGGKMTHVPSRLAIDPQGSSS
jgi:NhaP-type Na+/H+ or K+/H+ antiporter